MGLKESLRKLQEDEQKDKKLSLKREVKKELTKLKNEKIAAKKCLTCGDDASYSIKGSNEWYCRECAIEYFGDLKHLKKINIKSNNETNLTEKNPINKFRDHVIEKSSNPGFIHHEWYVKYHLEIVERLSLELCRKHKNADKDLVLILVWLHDYEKISSHEKNNINKLDLAKIKMVECAIPQPLIEKAILYAKIIDKKMEIDLNNSPIEVKIISSADGASHMVGPFFEIYAHENPQKPFEDIMQDNLKKLEKDWTRKIVISSVKKAFSERYKFLSEQFGKMPKKFLK